MILYAVTAYRATKHSSTGLTANMMLFGKVTEPVDLVAGLPLDTDNSNTHPQYVQQVRERLELSHQLAWEVLGKPVERITVNDSTTKTSVRSGTKLVMQFGT